jgi:hypothetical protein
LTRMPGRSCTQMPHCLGGRARRRAVSTAPASRKGRPWPAGAPGPPGPGGVRRARRVRLPHVVAPVWAGVVANRPAAGATTGRPSRPAWPGNEPRHDDAAAMAMAGEDGGGAGRTRLTPRLLGHGQVCVLDVVIEPGAREPPFPARWPRAAWTPGPALRLPRRAVVTGRRAWRTRAGHGTSEGGGVVSAAPARDRRLPSRPWPRRSRPTTNRAARPRGAIG